MRLFLTTGKRDHLVICQPGLEFPTSDFLADDGHPLTFKVQFTDGEARGVPSNLGEYLIDKGVAQRTPIIADLAMAQRLEVHDERVRTHIMLTSQ
ncbi:hypothetical protein LFL96_21180 [Paraburkholderia sp. D15]|uniref:hypothetical protein n=1 Tax=Paraburkholderia sp. D15 TaxID=2880218 RepID=UPI00247A3BE3|nr:hypothetical protein [Paraburkholderia sp. D15]WGS53573.1 hypothetical protein LFL96_21180 [Paraburkholderia sp. D15]